MQITFKRAADAEKNLRHFLWSNIYFENVHRFVYFFTWFVRKHFFELNFKKQF